MSTKHWSILPKPNEDAIMALMQQLNVSEATAILLLNRNIDDFPSAKSFFRPHLSQLHDPFLMQDMAVAVSKIMGLIDVGGRILIYGDYDVDGTTSVSMMYAFLNENFPSLYLEYYIPDRYREGYGVSLQGIEYAKTHKFDLIITLDCGIKAHKAVELAAQYNIEVIICDHHLPDETLPKAVAVLNPKRVDCEYPYKELSGCGVGFKLIHALCLELNLDAQNAFKYLDYVTISICADIVPITGENRILAHHGIKMLNENKKPGIEALKVVAGIKTEINVHHIVFGFAPRINAAGRIQHAKASVDLLIASTDEIATSHANVINANNTTRKDFDSNITKEALEMIENDPLSKDTWSTVLFKNDWNKGVVGIVASRCIEKHYKPTIILTESNGMAVGSARSIEGFDLYKGISECEELLEQFGGHMHAAGLTLKIDNIPLFREKFDTVVKKSISVDLLTPTLVIDHKLAFDEITHNFYKIIQQFAPFGPQNMQPLFVSEDVYFKTPIRIMKEEHIKITLHQINNNLSFEAVGFKMVEFVEILEQGVPFRICYQIVENSFNNQCKLELMLKDIKRAKR